MRSQQYSKHMVVLHWISALVICWALISGFYTGLLLRAVGVLVALHVGAVLKHELSGTRLVRRMMF
jgi:cytochrome b561